MSKYIVLSLTLLLLNACGVDTSSSTTSRLAPSQSGDVIDPNPVEGSNPSNPTDPSNPSNPTDPSNPSDPDCAESAVFECSNAQKDANACNPSFYKVKSDASYNGDNPGENGATFSVVDGHGLEFRSEHQEGDPLKADKTWVTLFYKNFPAPGSLGIQGYTSYTKSDVFFITYDIAWSDTSIPNIDNTVYMKSDKTDIPTCYRLKLNSVSGSNIDIQKVYR